MRHYVILYANTVLFSKVAISGTEIFGILCGCPLPSHTPRTLYVSHHTLAGTLWVQDGVPQTSPRQAVPSEKWSPSRARSESFGIRVH